MTRYFLIKMMLLNVTFTLQAKVAILSGRSPLGLLLVAYNSHPLKRGAFHNLYLFLIHDRLKCLLEFEFFYSDPRKN